MTSFTTSTATSRSTSTVWTTSFTISTGTSTSTSRMTSLSTSTGTSTSTVRMISVWTVTSTIVSPPHAKSASDEIAASENTKPNQNGRRSVFVSDLAFIGHLSIDCDSPPHARLAIRKVYVAVSRNLSEIVAHVNQFTHNPQFQQPQKPKRAPSSAPDRQHFAKI